MILKSRITGSSAMLIAAVAMSALASCSLSGIRIKNPDLATIRDGTYEGSYFILPVKVRVKVTVLGEKMRTIEILEHFNGRGLPAEAIVPLVLEGQSLDVDVIAGATHSSKTILKAIQNALAKGKP